MGLLEIDGVFQAKPQHAISPDVREPDKPDREQDVAPAAHRDPDKKRGTCVKVNKVVGRGTGLPIREIDRNRKVGDKKENSKKNPAFTVLPVEVERQGENGCALQAHKNKRG